MKIKTSCILEDHCECQAYRVFILCCITMIAGNKGNLIEAETRVLDYKPCADVGALADEDHDTLRAAASSSQSFTALLRPPLILTILLLRKHFAVPSKTLNSQPPCVYKFT